MADLTARDTVLVKYLNEAYGKEKQLETILQAQIGRTDNMPIKKRLREHLKETKAHARSVQSRIKALGGKADAGTLSAVTSLATKATAAAKSFPRASASPPGRAPPRAGAAPHARPLRASPPRRARRARPHAASRPPS